MIPDQSTVLQDTVGDLTHQLEVALSMLLHPYVDGGTGQVLYRPLVFDIRTPSANSITQKSKLPHDPEHVPFCMQKNTVARGRHQEELVLYSLE